MKYLLAIVCLTISSFSNATWYFFEPAHNTMWEIPTGEIIEVGNEVHIWNSDTNLEWRMTIEEIKEYPDGSTHFIMYHGIDDEVIELELLKNE